MVDSVIGPVAGALEQRRRLAPLTIAPSNWIIGGLRGMEARRQALNPAA
jgi:hypothetical protein